MERKEFFELCQRAAVQTKGLTEKQYADRDVVVEHNKSFYLPVSSYPVFDCNGKYKHVAILQEFKTNTNIIVNLEDVKDFY